MLDSGCSHTFVHERALEYISNGSNLLVQFDGGCRYLVFSATGSRILAFSKEDSRPIILVAGGRIFVGNRVSFSIGAQALHEVLSMLADIFNKKEIM